MSALLDKFVDVLDRCGDVGTGPAVVASIAVHCSSLCMVGALVRAATGFGFEAIKPAGIAFAASLASVVLAVGWCRLLNRLDRRRWLAADPADVDPDEPEGGTT